MVNLNYIRHHPIALAISAVVLFMSGVIEPWWSMFSAEPLFPILYRWVGTLGLPREVSVPPLMWITGPIGLAVLAFVFYAVLSRSAKLTVAFQQAPPYLWSRSQRTFYRIGVLNKGPAAAENVEVWLDDVTPPPQSPYFPRDFPYRVLRNEFETAQAAGCMINPHQEELFEIARSWVGSGGGLIIDGIETKYPLARIPGAFEIGRDESWELSYRVVSANGQPLRITVVMRSRGDMLSVYLKP